MFGGIFHPDTLRTNSFSLQREYEFKNMFFFFLFYLTLQYCIGFATYQNESATGIHVFTILNPPPSSLPIPSLGRPSAPAPSIQYRALNLDWRLI